MRNKEMKAALEAFETLRPPAHFQPSPFDATSLKSVLHPSSEFARQRLAVRSETTDRIPTLIEILPGQHRDMFPLSSLRTARAVASVRQKEWRFRRVDWRALLVIHSEVDFTLE
jgi:hypothetical protein